MPALDQGPGFCYCNGSSQLATCCASSNRKSCFSASSVMLLLVALLLALVPVGSVGSLREEELRIPQRASQPRKLLNYSGVATSQAIRSGSRSCPLDSWLTPQCHCFALSTVSPTQLHTFQPAYTTPCEPQHLFTCHHHSLLPLAPPHHLLHADKAHTPQHCPGPVLKLVGTNAVGCLYILTRGSRALAQTASSRRTILHSQGGPVPQCTVCAGAECQADAGPCTTVGCITQRNAGSCRAVCSTV